MNSVVLIGRLARDPELTFSANQTAIAHFTLAVDRPRRQGEDQGADFIRITVFGKQAENCDRYLGKGRQAAVQGRIQTGSYQNREGVTVYTTDVIADRVEFLGGRGNGQETANPAPVQAPVQETQPVQAYQTQLDLPDSFAQAEDDIPF